MASHLLIAAWWTLGVVSQATPPPSEVRVGVVAYEDFREEARQFEQLFAALSQQDPSLEFRIALGSYGDVLHWMDRQLIDVAFLTPGVFARLLPKAPELQPAACRYLATVQLPAAKSSWALADRQAEGYHDTYRSVCLVREDSPLQTIDDLCAAAEADQVQFLMVHPLSVSGRIAPLEALRQVGLSPPKNRVRFTFSHSESIRMLSESVSDLERVAFVWDDAAGNDRTLDSGVRRLPFPSLDSLAIPHDVVVARAGFPQAEQIQKLLLEVSYPGQRYGFARLDDWRAKYGTVRRWLQAAGATASAEDGELISLDEIGQLLLLYSRSQPRSPRLAVVLSGGGAKCSYQVGAVAAFEEKLAELRREDPEHNIDIGLVVGTSGGAINSIPIALGVTRTDEGRQAFQDTWRRLDQRDIVRPSLVVRANMGLWFALLQTALVFWIVRRFVKEPERRGWIFAVVYTALAAAEILMGYVPVSPWRWLGSNHIAHHTLLSLNFGVRASAWSLLVIGVAAMVAESTRARRGRHIVVPSWLTKTTILTGLLGLPLLQLVTLLWWEETLSGGQGMERALADRFPPLINQHLEQNQLAPLDLADDAAAADRLRSVSRQLIERRLLRRDLVITGSCLAQSAQELPSDLYFYAPADSSPAVHPFGDRGVALLEHPKSLLDIVMGSGSIFPVFPARKIDGIPRKGEFIELVDGGFAHNSPIEAAVMWGATHIVLIEATPRRRSERGNFLKNAISSFRHLHRQAQLLDARSRQKVIVFSLTPEPPHMCVLDFADNLIDASIERGYRDASAGPGSDHVRFRRELGEPLFVEARTPSNAAGRPADQ